MKVIVVGCGRLGSDLAYRLYKRGEEVSVVDIDPAAFNSLPADFIGLTVEGDALNRDVLHRAGVESADGLVAASSSDALNAVVAHIAQTEYGIKRISVRNFNPECRSMQEIFGLQIVSSGSWGAQRLEELVYHGDLKAIFSAGNGEVEIYEFIVPINCNGRMLCEVVSEDGARVVSLTRGGRASIPEKDVALMTGDVLLVSTTLEGIEKLRELLCKEEEN